MHGLPHAVIAPQGKRKVAHSPADVSPRQVLSYPLHAPDEVEGVSVVLLHARGDGQHVGVEYDIAGIHPNDVHQYMVRPLGYLYASLISSGLPSLVETHHHASRPIPHHVTGMGNEDFLSLFQRKGIHDGLSLHALQPRHYDFPSRRVYHHGDAGYLRLGGNQVKEVGHLLFRVEQGIVHVDIQYHRAILHLLSGDGDSLIVLPVLDEPQKLSAARHVATLTHVDETSLWSYRQWLQARKQQPRTHGRNFSGSLVLRQGGETRNKLWRGATTASHDIHQTLVNVLLHLGSHGISRLVVLPQ